MSANRLQLNTDKTELVWTGTLLRSTIGLMHWLTVPQRLQYKLAVTVHRCLHQWAPRYLSDYCVPVSKVPGRQHLRSARLHQLSIQRVRRSKFWSHAFPVTEPTVWYSVTAADDLRDPAVDWLIPYISAGPENTSIQWTRGFSVLRCFT